MGRFGAFSFTALLAVVGCSTDQFVSVDAGADATCDDPTFCDGKCGSGLADKCGRSRDCGGCGDGICDGNTHTCKCNPIPKAEWCAGRCGATKDNCGSPIDCGACQTGTCTNNSCSGCVDDGKACTGKECGTAKNNCGAIVQCGVCPQNGTCNANTCCEAFSKTCGSSACGPKTNNCGLPIDCGSCLIGSCCAGKCTNTNNDFDNCGGCGASCKGISNATTCELGGCTCQGHGSNSDVNNCGPCNGNVGMNCSDGGRTKCVLGACR